MRDCFPCLSLPIYHVMRIYGVINQDSLSFDNIENTQF